ncbi:MAG: hypothetical protein VKJ46_06860, partial [Leptolyngbyaceae bacterium]|nr:hypothetical protein [Leptolyngbyaceae bacterium]
ALLLFLNTLGDSVSAQSSINLESRLSILESENLQLRNQVNRLESLISGVNRGTAQVPRSDLPSTPNAPPPYRAIAPKDPMFDRLATLVIELKERLDKLDTRLTQLEKRALR